MDWRAVTFDWNRVRAFLVTAEEGSLSAAARALGLTQPTLGRQVEALERELGVALFERHGRGLGLTPAGEDLLAHARRMGDGASDLALAVAGLSDEIAGEVSISASDIYAARLFPPILARLHAEHPDLRIEVVVDNQLSDLRRRAADLAIRNVRPDDPELIGRKLRDAAARLYASPELLDRLGRPSTPEGFAGAPVIEIDHSGALEAMMAGMGFPVDRMKFPYRTGNFVAAWEMVRAGHAICIIDDRIGDAEPGVERILPDLAPVHFPVWLVAHRDVRRARRLRVVWDALADGLR
ncbi:LysR family transcriptional regulator [Jannaschia seohaensis]|uniref:DNA-binding transcriptional LysR family regulator n=1 Tax=Jannaschia seohaensis TaxID=475081 RepID=A0A2Y9AA24_9RHOB|nr:LysR family transcriptional regulator [Jannaschia seohaensis]PWJ20994.1 DNA-binding transcriptional LysR family regulator [Jannaschia seohaensis]SSA41404.1 DNA-binding transcriptional regulator, LysR family [Jannaschia seohaensis]